MKSNILFVGLAYEYVKKVSKEICDGFDMFFLDVNDLIEYNLLNIKNVEKVCGVEYLKKEQEKIALSTNSYENAVINMPYSLFLNNGIAEKLKENSLIVYLKLPKRTLNSISGKLGGLLQESIAYEEFDKLIAKKCDVVVKCKNSEIKDGVNITLNALKTYLL